MILRLKRNVKPKAKLFLFFIDRIPLLAYNKAEVKKMRDTKQREVFARNLNQYMKSRGVEQADIVMALGITASTVSDWVRGKKYPRVDAMQRLADFFGILLSDLTKEDTLENKREGYRIPVFGSIPAGIPWEAIEDIEDYEEIPADWTRGGKEYFALRVKGDSMYPRYEDGDVVIFRKSDTCESGQDCAVMVDSADATFKRVRITPTGVTLQPLNPEYDPLTFSNREVMELPVRILGVVVELRRTL